MEAAQVRRASEEALRCCETARALLRSMDPRDPVVLGAVLAELATAQAALVALLPVVVPPAPVEAVPDPEPEAAPVVEPVAAPVVEEPAPKPRRRR